jgi:hypothetical protein
MVAGKPGRRSSVELNLEEKNKPCSDKCAIA